jgi:hypothetical protein
MHLRVAIEKNNVPDMNRSVDPARRVAHADDSVWEQTAARAARDGCCCSALARTHLVAQPAYRGCEESTARGTKPNGGARWIIWTAHSASSVCACRHGRTTVAAPMPPPTPPTPARAVRLSLRELRALSRRARLPAWRLPITPRAAAPTEWADTRAGTRPVQWVGRPRARGHDEALR